MRQGQWANYSGTILTKTPDLCVKLRDDENPPHPVLPEFNGLFVECKPVDAKHPVSSRYCEDGLIRFVRGDYAWAMQEGMMLGYARDGRTVAKHLIPVMSKPRHMENLKTVSLPVAPRASSVRPCPSAEATTSVSTAAVSHGHTRKAQQQTSRFIISGMIANDSFAEDDIIIQNVKSIASHPPFAFGG